MNLDPDRRLPYGYKESAGLWSINLEQPPLPTIDGLRELADRASRAFLEAFAGVCTVHSADGVTIEIGEDGRIQEIWGEVVLAQHTDGVFRPATNSEAGSPLRNAAIASFTVRCDVLVEQPGRGSVILENGLYFEYDSGLQTLVGEQVTFDTAFVSVAAEVDPWLDAPFHDGRFLDNRITAALNRPRLERALRRWEAELGAPISDVTSVPYPALVDRYGFRPGGEPDPP